MAARHSHSRHEPQESAALQKLKLTSLQKAILRWLRQECRLRRQAGLPEIVPYPDLVQALEADKASITEHFCRLMRKGLVLTVVPRGAWVRAVTFTEEGETYAALLSKEERQQRQRQRW